MEFSPLNLTVNGVAVTFNPYDRGASGAFVYRKAGVTLQAPRLVVSTVVDDNASDKYAVANNTPSVLPAAVGSGLPDKILGTDLVKTELRFLATTSEASRVSQIDTHVAALQELRATFEKRAKIYS